MIRFGVAGFPPNFFASKWRKKRQNIIAWLSEQNLEALELQMTYGPRMKVDSCRLFRELALEHKVRLSVHASYFIVLTSAEPIKIANSIDTLARTFDLAGELGAQEVVLHPGSIYGGDPAAAVARFVENAGSFLSRYGQCDARIFVETAGKLGQLGSLEEILSICRYLPNVHPCIDFGHIHARSLGTLDNAESIACVVKDLNAFLGDRSERRVHFHYTPIHYGPRGEIQHRAIDDIQTADTYQGSRVTSNVGGKFHPRHEPVATAVALVDVDATVISETHNSQDIGASALKMAFHSLRGASASNVSRMGNRS